MKIVLTNDDGYGEPGLTTLTRIAQQMGKVVVVAPRTAQSGIGHQVTMKDPLKVEPQDRADHFAVHGTPADCTRLALKQILPEADWVLAGINPGANLGSDIYQSGTVAAVREAAILGVKAIAVSQYIGQDWTLDWDAAARHLPPILKMVMKQPHAPGRFWNINLPSPLSADEPVAHRFCPLDTHPHKYRYRKDGDLYHYEGVIHDRPRAPESDVAVCFGGEISITCMAV